MTIFDYAAMAKTAKELIEKFGQTLNYTRVTDAAPADPTKPWIPSATSETVSVKAVVLNPTIGDRGTFVVDGIQAHRRQFILPDVGFVPNVRDTISYQSRTWAVTEVSESNPGGVDLIYTVTAES